VQFLGKIRILLWIFSPSSNNCKTVLFSRVRTFSQVIILAPFRVFAFEFSLVLTFSNFFLESLELFEKFSNANIRSSFVQLASDTNEDITIQKVLHFKQYSSCGVVVNCACKGYDLILSEVSLYSRNCD
jgi:hypothetical protein